MTVWADVGRGKLAGWSVTGVLGLVTLSCLVLALILGPMLWSVDPNRIELSSRLQQPVWLGGNWTHPLGTDGLGRDILARILAGGRTSLGIATAATAIAGLIGCTLGIAAGYFGRMTDLAVQFIVVTRLATPGMVLVVALIALIGPSTLNLVLVIGLLAWPPFAVVTRVATQSLCQQDFMLAAIAVGSTRFQIIRQELLPNLVGPITVIATLELGYIILAEASLSFLGLGVQPPDAAWGLMLNEGKPFIHIAPWLILIPGLAILLLVLALNLIAESLREVTDPTRIAR